jgi:recombinational DNA repair protein (RecF pathway)
MSTEKFDQLTKSNLPAATLDELKDHMLTLIERHIEKKLQTRKMLSEALEPLS